MRRRVTVLTVGCKANFSDSSSIVRKAIAAGFDIVDPSQPADVIIVNSCTVTHRADRDSRSLVRRARRNHPCASIVMTGCYAENLPSDRDKLPEADHWITIGESGALDSLLEKLGGGPAEHPRVSAHAADLLLGHRRTFLKIQDGCDFACAYCVVPSVRGKSRSREEKGIVEAAVEAERDGARELVLTGIHIGSYGAERGERDGLANLLRALLRETSSARFRLSSIEPMEMTDGLVDTIAENPRICRHLHIPLQSGCDGILLKMRRPYKAAGYARIAARASMRVPGLQIGSDVIAGFPGESKDHFEETVRFLEGVPVNYLHVFPYSARRGTESASWKDDVAPSEKKERVARLLRLSADKKEAFLKSQVGNELEVLAEKANPARMELSGHSGNYVEVAFRGGKEGLGKLVKVRATSFRGRMLSGRCVGTQEADGR